MELISDQLVAAEDRVYAWIEEIFAHGIRRPAYEADRWAEQWLQEQFRSLGLENVRGEPVDLTRWESVSVWFSVTVGSETHEFPAFPLPHTAPTPALEAPLVPFDLENPDAVRDAVALYEVSLTRLQNDRFAGAATWTYDPRDTFAGPPQVLPFGRELQSVMEPAMAAGAVGFVGVLTDYPGDSFNYYVPYDAISRPIPGVWISSSSGRRLNDLLAAGSVRARLRVETRTEPATTYNVVGELPGADDETVIIGSHHDGPWSSAVEDASGMALVLAQATYWSQVPVSDRPHRLVFLVNSGHMYGGAGVHAFIEQHKAELDGVVLEVHLEHAAAEFVERDGALVPNGEPETRWWFTSRIPELEMAVQQAIEQEDLQRSMILRPDIFAPYPTTDGGPFHAEGVPLVNFLTAPFYLFDAMDTMDKIHRPSLVPVTRAALRIIESTRGVGAAQMRAGVVEAAPA
jgi:Peptidase family M28